MNIVILSRNRRLYSTQRLIQAARVRGHKVRVIDPLKCYMNITSQEPSVYYKDEELRDVDAVIPRIGASITFYGTAVVRQFEMKGVFCLNESVTISRARDKLRALQMLSKKGIGLPITGFAHTTKQSQKLIGLVKKPPVVVKLLQGTQGRGVVLCETVKAAESVIDAMRGVNAHFLVQEFVKEAAGEDIRLFVVGNEVVASMKRRGPEGEFRSNLHRGGAATPVEISDAERETALKASRILGLRVAGVDILRSQRGPLVMEVNSSPGLEGIENTTKIDVAGKIIEYLEANVTSGREREAPVG